MSLATSEGKERGIPAFRSVISESYILTSFGKIIFNPIVISNKISQYNLRLKANSLAASFGIHLLIIGSAFYLSVHQPITEHKEESITISLAEYTPSNLSSQSLTARMSTPIPSRSTSSTSQQRLPSTPAVSPEASAPQTSAVRPGVVPSDIRQHPSESLHSALNPVANGSPHDASIPDKTDELPKTNVSSDDINGATLGRIRALIENSLTYPSIGRKLRLEGTVVVSFILTANGSVKKAEILTSSGSNLLDAKAIQTVLELSGNYPSIPKTVSLKIPIVFSLNQI